MKKLKMIVTSVVVLVIIGSVFSFNSKKIGLFCVSNAGTNQCDAILQDRKITTGVGTTFKYLACWDFDQAKCTGTNNNCTATVKLTTN